MKKILALVIFLSSMLLLSCGGEDEKSGTSLAMICFIDKSESIKLPFDRRKQLEQRLNELLRFFQNDLNQGVIDRLDLKLHLIHGNTLGSGEVRERFFFKAKPVDKNAGGMDRRAVENENAAKARGVLKRFQKAFWEKIEEENRSKTKSNTDIWASLEVAANFFRKCDADNKVVFFASDMIEAVYGNERRNFRKNPPASLEEARRFAQEDHQRIKSRFKVASLDGVKIIVWPLTEENEENDLRFLRYYWEELFALFGAKAVDF